MALPSWIRRKSERVRREDVLMELPPVDSAQWIEAASRYMIEAGQMVVALGELESPIDDLLERAGRNFEVNSPGEGNSLVETAVSSLREVESPDCLQGWVKVAMVASKSTDEELRDRITQESISRLRESGLRDVADALGYLPAVQKEYGAVTAMALGSGLLSAVNQRCFQDAMVPHGD